MGKHNKLFSRITLKFLKICTSIVTIASCNNNIISNENFNSEKLKDIWEDIENIQQALNANVVNIDIDFNNEVYHYLTRIITKEVVLDDTCVSTLKGYSDQLKDSIQMANSLNVLSEKIKQYIAQKSCDLTVQNNNEERNNNTNQTKCCNSVNYTSPSAKKENTTPSAFNTINKKFLSYDNKTFIYNNSHLTLKQRQKNQEAKRKYNDRKSSQQCCLIQELLLRGYIITIEKIRKRSKKSRILFKLKSITKNGTNVFNDEDCDEEVKNDFQNKIISTTCDKKSIRRYFDRRSNNVMIYLLKKSGFNFSFQEEKLKSENKYCLEKYSSNRIYNFTYKNKCYRAEDMYSVGEILYQIIFDNVQQYDHVFTGPLTVDESKISSINPTNALAPRLLPPPPGFSINPTNASTHRVLNLDTIPVVDQQTPPGVLMIYDPTSRGFKNLSLEQYLCWRINKKTPGESIISINPTNAPTPRSPLPHLSSSINQINDSTSGLLPPSSVLSMKQTKASTSRGGKNISLKTTPSSDKVFNKTPGGHSISMKQTNAPISGVLPPPPGFSIKPTKALTPKVLNLDTISVLDPQKTPEERSISMKPINAPTSGGLKNLSLKTIPSSDKVFDQQKTPGER